MELHAPNYERQIADSLNIKASQVGTAIRLMDEGNTIPFIARYRKEMTGELDEVQLRDIASHYETQRNLHTRKTDVARLLNEQGVFADDAVRSRLMKAIQEARSITEVDDIYRPYRPKRKTRASAAREKGLEPLAIWLRHVENRTSDECAVFKYANEFVSGDTGVSPPLEAIQGASDIIAEDLADDPVTRRWVREQTLKHGFIRSAAVDSTVESVYEVYYRYEEPLAKVPPHRVLAMNRGEREEFLKVSITIPQEQLVPALTQKQWMAWYRFAKEPEGRFDGTVRSILEAAIMDAYKRLLAPAIEREIRHQLTEVAEEQAIKVFGENLSKLLMQPPIRGKNVLGVDPAYRTGCKLAVVDETGKLLYTTVIYPTPPQNKTEAAKQTIVDLISKFNISVVAIGNGTASRETEAFIADCTREYKHSCGLSVPYIIVSEAGASVYSASEVAREEFPELDVAERSAISIARRIQDPLAELVKIDPKSVGVGQYQHDVSQKQLDEKLAAIVETAVNRVGVDVNTASPSLLSYVAGLNKTVAKNIVTFRENSGRITSRSVLAAVPRLGPKTLEQCVGFLRIFEGSEPLDSTPIHPESYGAVRKLLNRFGDSPDFFKDKTLRAQRLNELRNEPMQELCRELEIGEPTLRDILDELERPGRDPREDVPAPILRTDVLKIEDLSVGMVLTGTVRNVVDFGAFVDIGIKNDGLVHISQLADKFIKHPLDVVSLGDVVQVKVVQVDVDKGRVGLSMKEL